MAIKFNLSIFATAAFFSLAQAVPASKSTSSGSFTVKSVLPAGFDTKVELHCGQDSYSMNDLLNFPLEATNGHIFNEVGHASAVKCHEGQPWQISFQKGEQVEGTDGSSDFVIFRWYLQGCAVPQGKSLRPVRFKTLDEVKNALTNSGGDLDGNDVTCKFTQKKSQV